VENCLILLDGYTIPPENIEWIGSWDETGFTPTDAFMKYVKEECKQACMKLFGIG
jgi:hypothetical protein